jgi:hypothetical protein
LKFAKIYRQQLIWSSWWQRKKTNQWDYTCHWSLLGNIPKTSLRKLIRKTERSSSNTDFHQHSCVTRIYSIKILENFIHFLYAQNLWLWKEKCISSTKLQNRKHAPFHSCIYIHYLNGLAGGYSLILMSKHKRAVMKRLSYNIWRRILERFENVQYLNHDPKHVNQKLAIENEGRGVLKLSCINMNKKKWR